MKRKLAQILILAIELSFTVTGCSKKEERPAQLQSEQENSPLSPIIEVSDSDASLAALNVLKARSQEKDGALYTVAEDCESQIRDAMNESVESARALEWRNARAFCSTYARDFCRNPSPGTSTYNKCEIFNRIKQS